MLRSDVTRLTTHIKTSLSQIGLITGLNVDSKARIIISTRLAAMLQKKLNVFVARFTEALSKSASKCLLVTLL